MMEWLVYEGKAALVLAAIWLCWRLLLQRDTILNQLKSDGYPTYFVMGRDGMNGSVLVGFNEEKLKNLIDKVLK